MRPPPLLFRRFIPLIYLRKPKLSAIIVSASVAQWIEHLASDQGVAGSTPVRRAGPLAQLVEHLPLKETVTGSTPVRLTSNCLNFSVFGVSLCLVETLLGFIHKIRGFVLSHKIVAVVATVAFLLLFFFVLRPKNSNVVLTEQVKKHDIVKSVSVTGKVDADNSVNLSFQTGGKLAYLGVKKGDSVSAGEVIASLDVASVMKNLKSALIDYSKQRNTFEQTLDDNNANTINDAPNEKIKRILENNQFDLDKSVNSVELISLAKENSYLTTPISGVVTRTDVTVPGVNVTPTTVFSVTDPSSLFFSMDVDETDIGGIEIGQDVLMSMDAFPADNLESTVTNIDFVSHTTTSGGSAFTVRTALPGSRTYRVGMSGNADIVISSRKDVLTISSSSITGGNYVLVKKGNIFEKRKVKLGLENDTDSQVLSGLSLGEEVAIDPNSVPQSLIKK